MANPLTTLRKLIVDTHDADELRTLCFDLGVSYDALPGEGTPARARELILYLGRHRQLARLLAALGQGRPEAFAQAGLEADPAAVQALEAALPAWEAAELGAEADKLRQMIAGMVELGLPVAPAQERLAALGARLEQLDVPATYRAEVKGSGAVAQGPGAVAAGEGGAAVGRDVHGNVIVGGEHRHYHGPPGTDPDALREAYLYHVLEEVGHVALTGVDPKAASEAETRLNLGAVYTGLRTLTPQEHDQLRGDPAGLEPGGRERGRLSVVDQLNRRPKLVLLGDPGSGKTTFVNFVAMCMAGQLLGRPEANLTRLTEALPQEDDKEPDPQSWDHGALLPVRVVLRDFAAQGLPAVGERATAKHLWDFVTGQLQAAALGEYVPHLAQALFKQGGLVLLDGLDEVPAAEQRREQIKQAVEDFAATFRKCRLLVTSRTYAYQQQAWRLNGFTEAVLAPFERGQIDRFVERWYVHIAPLRGLSDGDAQGRAELLRRAIRSSDRLAALAARPLLLTLMASLHAWRGGSLPEKREQLYADTVDLLLDWWERPKVVRDRERVIVQQPSLVEWLRVDRDQVRALLERLAYQAHAAQPGLVGTADVPEGELLSGLMQLSRNPQVNPARLVEYLSWRAGLLLPRGVGVYTFPHRTFQEYLAVATRS